MQENLFSLITHAGNMHHVKPNREYYQEICNLMDREPTECLMIGNDPVFDLSAGLTGMKTFLLENSYQKDSSYSRELQEELGLEQVTPTGRGSLQRPFSLPGRVTFNLAYS